jgi:predicted RNA-binding Zn-ribbon protein involved in translation (DUF1610 family)
MTETCLVCGQTVRAGARFCTACGNVLQTDPSSNIATATDRFACPECGAVFVGEARFCRGCGTERPHRDAPGAGHWVDASFEGESHAEAVLVGLNLAPFGAIVLAHRPGTKKFRRCEVLTDGYGNLPNDERQRLVGLLVDSFVWDGYLYATVLIDDANHQLSCIWHVLNGELFPLTADHAQSLLLYVDGLAPSGWSEPDLENVVDAPRLDLGSAP